VRNKLRRAEQEEGQVLVLAALFMTVLLGFAAFVIDFGGMASTKRQLQNAADAAALAGVASLPDDEDAAAAAAYEYAEKNEFGNPITMGAPAIDSSGPGTGPNTISVAVSRTVDFQFGRVLGLTNRTITATAKARIFRVTAIPVTAPSFFPFAIWAGNTEPPSVQGTNVVFRGNQWSKAPNIKDFTQGCSSPKKPANNCNWDINDQSFNGYFHWQNGSSVIRITPAGEALPVNQGGNAFGTAEIASLAYHYATGTPIVLPVVSYGTSQGSNLQIRIVSFACVRITDWDSNGSIDWRGDIVNCSVPGFYDGTPPAPDLPAATVPALID
jgi:Flp pilus assembly protein TadG